MGPRPAQGRAAPERPFIKALRHQATQHDRAAAALDELLVEPVAGIGVTHYLQDDGELRQLREYAAQRSLYHLKDADPRAWVLPLLWGRAKAGMAAVEFDEFGGGRAERGTRGCSPTSWPTSAWTPPTRGISTLPAPRHSPS